MEYLDEWETSVGNRKKFTKAERKKMLLSEETLEGLRVTGKFIEHNIDINGMYNIYV